MTLQEAIEQIEKRLEQCGTISQAALLEWVLYLLSRVEPRQDTGA